MDINLIIGAVVGFLGTAIGRKIIIYLWKKLGGYTERTENKYDDKVYEMTPNFLDMLTDHLDLGEVEKVLDDILADLEETNKDTAEIEKEIKKKKESIKK